MRTSTNFFSLNDEKVSDENSVYKELPKEGGNAIKEEYDGRTRSGAIAFTDETRDSYFDKLWLSDLEQENDQLFTETQLGNFKPKIENLIRRLNNLLKEPSTSNSVTPVFTKAPISSAPSVQIPNPTLIDKLEEQYASLSPEKHSVFFKQRVEKLKQQLDKLQKALPHNVVDFASFEFISPEVRIQTSTNYRFNIHSLVKLINIQKKYMNPYTGEIFKEEDQDLIKDFAQKKGLTINIRGAYHVEEPQEILQGALDAARDNQSRNESFQQVRFEVTSSTGTAISNSIILVVNRNNSRDEHQRIPGLSGFSRFFGPSRQEQGAREETAVIRPFPRP